MKNGTEVTLKLSSNVVGDAKDTDNSPHISPHSSRFFRGFVEL